MTIPLTHLSLLLCLTLGVLNSCKTESEKPLHSMSPNQVCMALDEKYISSNPDEWQITPTKPKSILIVLPSEVGGLLSDAQVYNTFLKKLGHHTECTYSDYTPNGKVYDANIFIQDIAKSHLKFAKKNYWMANQEFIFNPDDLAGIDTVLCKSKHCKNVMEKLIAEVKASAKVSNTGFTSFVDKTKVNLDALKYDFFFHPAGKSEYKQTDVVGRVWMLHPDFPKIIMTCVSGCGVLSQAQISEMQTKDNIELHLRYLPKNRLDLLQKTAGFVIAPSAVEGFGHYINESRGYGSIVISTDFGPMNELIRPEYGFLVKSNVVKYFFAAQAPVVATEEKDLAEAVQKALNLSEDERREMSKKARQSFIDDEKKFAENLSRVFSE